MVTTASILGIRYLFQDREDPPDNSTRNEDTKTEDKETTSSDETDSDKLDDKIDDDRAKELFVNSSSRGRRQRKKIAKKMIITHIYSTNAFHKYTLRSEVEHRKLEWITIPYRGQYIPVNRPYEDNPWAIPVFYQSPHPNDQKVISVQGTEQVVACDRCQGSGEHTCSRCRTREAEFVSSWSGPTKEYFSCDHEQVKQCQTSVRDGLESCPRCRGRSVETCLVCNGKKEVCIYLQLTIRWSVMEDEHVFAKTTSLDEPLIKSAVGYIVAKEDDTYVKPLTNIDDPEIKHISSALIKKHLSNLTSDQHIIHQCHQLRSIPVLEIDYTSQNNQEKFYVYGREKSAHYTEEFPNRICDCC